jgi:effector-binding domain-containing protein
MSPRSAVFLALVGIALGLTAPRYSLAQTTPTPPAEATPAAPAAPEQSSPAPSKDPFGEEVTLPAKTIVFVKGSGSWDNAFETITDRFKSIKTFLDKQKVQPDGAQMTIYTATDDTGFQFQAAVPVAEPPKNLPRGMAVGKSPEGKALKFVHRGSYDAMDNTYEAITNHLDEKRLEAKDLFIEEYVTDPLNTAEDNLIINVFVPIK